MSTAAMRESIAVATASVIATSYSISWAEYLAALEYELDRQLSRGVL